MDITIPGEQKPHCDPWPWCSLSWTGWRPVLVEPTLSTVLTWLPWRLARGSEQAVTVLSSSPSSLPPLHLERRTVQLPQELSPQASLHPVRPTDLRYCSRLSSSLGTDSLCFSPAQMW